MSEYKYYDKNRNELSHKFLKDFYEKSEILIISGLTNTGKETLAKFLTKDSDSYGTISVNENFHTLNVYRHKIGLIHESSIENTKRVFHRIFNDLESYKNINYIHIEKKTNKYILDIQ